MNIKKTLSFSTTLIVLGLLFFNSTSLKTAAAEAAEQPSPGFLCNHCQAVFPNVREFRSHEENEEQPKSELFYCSVCPHSTKYSYALTTHFRTHTGERPFVCDSCPSIFGDSKSLTNHKRIHSGEKPYECPTCKQTFRQQTHLKSHTQSDSSCNKRVMAEGAQEPLSKRLITFIPRVPQHNPALTGAFVLASLSGTEAQPAALALTPPPPPLPLTPPPFSDALPSPVFTPRPVARYAIFNKSDQTLSIVDVCHSISDEEEEPSN